jgi:hypothetical protein
MPAHKSYSEFICLALRYRIQAKQQKGPGKPEPFAVVLIFALANICEASVT